MLGIDFSWQHLGSRYLQEHRRKDLRAKNSVLGGGLNMAGLDCWVRKPSPSAGNRELCGPGPAPPKVPGGRSQLLPKTPSVQDSPTPRTAAGGHSAHSPVPVLTHSSTLNTHTLSHANMHTHQNIYNCTFAHARTQCTFIAYRHTNIHMPVWGQHICHRYSHTFTSVILRSLFPWGRIPLSRQTSSLSISSLFALIIKH